jgi:peptidyl-prolyl cis-trans isomerase SDCCAG10
MEGYYDNTIFHPIIKTFMVQGGDLTGTGTGGDTMYGGPFVDEVRSRLRFNPRGLAACANAGTANINNSQFFLALNRCDWLDKKNMILGRSQVIQFTT